MFFFISYEADLEFLLKNHNIKKLYSICTGAKANTLTFCFNLVNNLIIQYFKVSQFFLLCVLDVLNSRVHNVCI